VRILGIDTAMRCTGYGIIEVKGQQISIIDCGTLRNKQKLSHSECLYRLFKGTEQLINTFHPDQVAIEGTFFDKYPKTVMVLGMARGAALTATAIAELPSFEYAPKRAKQALTGSGSSSKQQVAAVIAAMFNLDLSKIEDDATDALAMAICHAHAIGSPLGKVGKQI